MGQPQKNAASSNDSSAGTTKSSGKENQVEGEGSYTATRRYNKHLAEHQSTENVEELADEAREAVEGPEAEELRRAEEQGKRGPKQSKS